MHELGEWTWNFIVVAAKENKVILEFEHMSRLNVMGMCGAGMERGYVLIEFNEKQELIGYQIYLIESCLTGIMTDKEVIIDDNVWQFDIEDYSNEKNYTLIVDIENFKIIIK